MPRTNKTLSFKGGYRFRGFQGETTDELVDIAPGAQTSIPLQQTDTATVSNGDDVAVGQIVAESDGGPHRVTVSPVKGKVVAVSDQCIQVECSGDQQWSPVQGASAEWENLGNDRIEDILLASGSCAVVADGIPTRHGTSVLGPEDVRRVVIHDSASEVFSTSLSVLMRDRDLSHLKAGVGILQKLYPSAECHVVLAPQAKALLAELASSGLTVHTGSQKYPQHLDAVLLGSICADEVPPNPSPADYGAVVMDLQALLQLRDAVVAGKPNIERIVALAGPGFTARPHVRVRIGTPVDQVIDGRVGETSVRIVCNSVMTGAQVDDTSAGIGGECSVLVAIPKAGPELVPFAKPGFRSDSFSYSFASTVFRLSKTLDDNLHGEERACIGCGYCEQVCPVGILPFDLHRYVQRDIIDEKLLRYGAFRCIDCNLCTYVCPSKIPLAKLIADGKKALLDEGYSPVPVVETEESAQ